MIFLDPAVTKDAFYTREREISEIESIVPEIQEKIVDAEDKIEAASMSNGTQVLIKSGLNIVKKSRYFKNKY